MENPIAARLAGLREQIARCEKEYGRASGSVQMIAVSKTQPASALRAAHAAGQRHFGENYLQEALAKQDALADLPGLVWHFIGPLQSNKTRPVAERFDWVHSVDRLKIARRLGEQRPAQRGPLNVLLQLNLSGEASKAGASPAEAPALAREIASLPGLVLRGLMCIPAPSADPQTQRAVFGRLRALRDTLQAEGLVDCR